MEQLKQKLLDAFSLGRSAKDYIDGILGARDADARADLRVVFARADLNRLWLLRHKFVCGDVIKCSYHRQSSDGHDSGCMQYWLADITSNRELLGRDYPSEDVLKAVCRSIRYWDYGVIDESTVRAVLDEVIAEREHARILVDELCGELEPVVEAAA